MVLAFIGRLIVGMAGAQAAFADQPALHQQIQSPVDRGAADVAPLGLQLRMEHLGVEVGVPLIDRGQDRHPFFRELELFVPQETLEAGGFTCLRSAGGTDIWTHRGLRPGASKFVI